MKKILLYLIFGFLTIIASGQNNTVENDQWNMYIGTDGCLDSMYFKQSGHGIAFNQENFRGPSWYLEIDDKVVNLSKSKYQDGQWVANYDYIDFAISYHNDNGRPLILATITSERNTPFQPTKAGIRLGIDTYMDQYPDWNSKLFPTMLRCEKTHFWGYFMSPAGKIVTVASPDAIASWSHQYSISWGEPPYWYWGHRITSINLDCINALPLPDRHPQGLYQLLPGESKQFRIYLDEIKNLSEFYPEVAKMADAPAIELVSTSGQKGEAFSFEVHNNHNKIEIQTPAGKQHLIDVKKDNPQYAFSETNTPGLYTITCTSATNKQTEALYYVRKPYSWYMQQAMQAVVDYPQKASLTHCESWYGFYTAFAGGKYFKANKNVKLADDHFKKVYPIIFDTASHAPHEHGFRIQNVSSIIGVLVDRYQLYNNKKDLKDAIGFADFLINSQTPDGAYRANEIHYTSVIYIAKSLMELLEALEGKKEYKSDYEKIFSSVQRAMDELEKNRANIQTEGEMTFEDGMIGCSALQLGRFALMMPEGKKRLKYQNAALDLLTQHRCLQQIKISDARMRMASLRFWEAQYDVLMANNFINSPHGWSSWTTYAYYYAYLLTGNPQYINRVFDGLNSAMQTINLDGKMRWAFMVNPYIHVTQMNRNIEGATPLIVPGIHYNAFDNSHDHYISGEAYVDMVSDWFYANANDNDVHEHFKCLEEIALSKAYIVEQNNGELKGYNCRMAKKGQTWEVIPSETMISKIHINTKNKIQLSIKGEIMEISPGMKWIEI